ncbi:hypothetical protein PR048_001566 [Dryococelus australis]|uniref:Uncharacterized protein n=1 Tax=Dryococelus australis TaxID=614101 RepID=A0ABQ9IHQ5_9NEOP|nr:hypothetical protein PR048_001566 [Dryococelus australis]
MQGTRLRRADIARRANLASRTEGVFVPSAARESELKVSLRPLTTLDHRRPYPAPVDTEDPRGTMALTSSCLFSQRRGFMQAPNTALEAERVAVVMIVVVDLTLPGSSCSSGLLFPTYLPLCYGQTRHCLLARASPTAAAHVHTCVHENHRIGGNAEVKWYDYFFDAGVATDSLTGRTRFWIRVLSLSKAIHDKLPLPQASISPSQKSAERFVRRATVAERLARSPPTKANQVTGFSQAVIIPDDAVVPRPLIPAPLHTHSITLIGSQDLAVKGRPNLFTHVSSGNFVVAPRLKLPTDCLPSQRNCAPVSSSGCRKKKPHCHLRQRRSHFKSRRREQHRKDKDHNATCMKCAIAATRKALNWRAVFSTYLPVTTGIPQLSVYAFLRWDAGCQTGNRTLIGPSRRRLRLIMKPKLENNAGKTKMRRARRESPLLRDKGMGLFSAVETAADSGWARAGPCANITCRNNVLRAARRFVGTRVHETASLLGFCAGSCSVAMLERSRPPELDEEGGRPGRVFCRIALQARVITRTESESDHSEDWADNDASTGTTGRDDAANGHSYQATHVASGRAALPPPPRKPSDNAPGRKTTHESRTAFPALRLGLYDVTGHQFPLPARRSAPSGLPRNHVALQPSASLTFTLITSNRQERAEPWYKICEPTDLREISDKSVLSGSRNFNACSTSRRSPCEKRGRFLTNFHSFPLRLFGVHVNEALFAVDKLRSQRT